MKVGVKFKLDRKKWLSTQQAGNMRKSWTKESLDARTLYKIPEKKAKKYLLKFV